MKNNIIGKTTFIAMAFVVVALSGCMQSEVALQETACSPVQVNFWEFFEQTTTDLECNGEHEGATTDPMTAIMAVANPGKEITCDVMKNGQAHCEPTPCKEGFANELRITCSSDRVGSEPVLADIIAWDGKCSPMGVNLWQSTATTWFNCNGEEVGINDSWLASTVVSLNPASTQCGIGVNGQAVCNPPACEPGKDGSLPVSCETRCVPSFKAPASPPSRPLV